MPAFSDVAGAKTLVLPVNEGILRNVKPETEIGISISQFRISNINFVVAAKSQQRIGKEFALQSRKIVFAKRQVWVEEDDKLKELQSYDSKCTGKRECNHRCYPDGESYEKPQWQVVYYLFPSSRQNMVLWKAPWYRGRI